MSVHDSPDETTTSSGQTLPPALDVDAVRSAREWIAGGGTYDRRLRDLLNAYENLAARYAYLSVTTVPVSDGVIEQDAHSDRLLLREIKALHQSIGFNGGMCDQCQTPYPCQTVALIEGKA